ncbi:trypsin-like peptidase domain-containing protein [soil metagenome]
MTFLEEAETSIQDLAQRIGGAVVGVGHRWAVGSGVVLEDGKVLTNAHNLRGKDVEITFDDGRTATGRATGVDVDGDVAVVSVDTGGATPIEWPRNGSGVGIGAPVFALSNPGGRGLRVTLGFVTGTERSFRGPRGRRITGSIEHTSPLLPGSSGGPVVDRAGRLVGVNTNRLGEGFYLAIPADEDLKERVDALGRGEAPTRARLGVGIAPSEVAQGLRRAVGLPEAEGLLVRLVEEGSAAAGAGLAEGDLIIEAAGRSVTTPDELHEALDSVTGEGVIELKLLRGTEARTASVAFGAATE